MRGARQEAACRAERVELARPGIGPLTPGAAHPVEARPARSRTRAAAGRAGPPAAAPAAGAPDRRRRHARHRPLTAASMAASALVSTPIRIARAGDLLAETGRLADELPGGLPRGVVAEPEGRVTRCGLHARASPFGGLVVGRAAQRGQRRLEDLVLLEPERVDGAEVFGLGLLDLIGEQRLGLVRRPLVEARVALPEMRRHGAAGIDDRARQGGGGRQVGADGRDASGHPRTPRTAPSSPRRTPRPRRGAAREGAWRRARRRAGRSRRRTAPRARPRHRARRSARRWIPR